MAASGRPNHTRVQDHDLRSQCSLAGLQDRLPLPWPTLFSFPPSPKRRYRSNYRYLGWEELQDPAAWQHLSDFDLLLRLVDFTPLRPVLAQRLGWSSAKGWTPFDPVSIFLLLGWQLTEGWNRSQLLANLQDPRYADYATRFGFQKDVFPTEGGLRHWLTALGQHAENGDTVSVGEEEQIEVAVQYLNQLLAQTVALLLEAGLISPAAWDQALICPDGMLHDAASRLRCTAVTETCYQPTSAKTPRPCPAKEKDRRGCDCDTASCQLLCRQATPRDPEARFVWYTGSNRQPNNPNTPTSSQADDRPRGKGRYGYASLPLLPAEPSRRFHLVLLDDFFPANQRLENPFAAQLCQLATFYPTLHVDAVAGDAAFGYDVVLHTVYEHLQARRVIDLRADESDRDHSMWPLRGYDDRGRPVCPFGYALSANGFDYQRLRHKWACFHACQKGVPPRIELPDLTYPPTQCPYTCRPSGQLLNVGERFRDGSSRLVRDLPVGSTTWKTLYHQARNASESRNATFQRWGLKRLPVYGSLRSKAMVFLADVWVNLTTLVRLIREATAATGAT
jgi:hypothetical protein